MPMAASVDEPHVPKQTAFVHTACVSFPRPSKHHKYHEENIRSSPGVVGAQGNSSNWLQSLILQMALQYPRRRGPLSPVPSLGQRRADTGLSMLPSLTLPQADSSLRHQNKNTREADSGKSAEEEREQEKHLTESMNEQCPKGGAAGCTRTRLQAYSIPLSQPWVQGTACLLGAAITRHCKPGLSPH